MKKVLLTAGLTIALSGTAMAQSGPGCGLGSMLFKGKSGTVNHVLASITNGIYSNQAFGMSTGTLGCDTSQPIEYTEVAAYMDANLDQVAVDMARGEGESLDGLATLLDVPASERAAFAATAQANFTRIFPSAETTRETAVEELMAVLREDEALAEYALNA
ncbi:DUF3015 family protein [Saccharospirillum salsuginis]|uniref:DUF3015 domain-containing protein n=1 Tax=Saccharospirillum salsuginis TaxID=418750 RepID=A0A918NG30_9GAMM|nr:DUF3015 family protein [Saccharospirillum salsuginis]GGX64895.1 hypothetical protein GCM10007392_35940 [Saccharospirillum salsuginis]